MQAELLTHMLYAQALVDQELAGVLQEIKDRKKMVQKVEGSGETSEVSQANDGWYPKR